MKTSNFDNEAEFRTALIWALRALGAHVTPIESKATQFGIPDLNFYLNAESWAEVKYEKARGKQHEVRGTQKKWALARTSRGGSVYFVMYSAKDNWIYIVDGIHVQQILGKVDRMKWASVAASIELTIEGAARWLTKNAR